MIERGKTPPSGFWRGIRKNTVFVRFDGLGDHVIVWGFVRSVFIIIFHFHHCIGDRLSVEFNDPLEKISGIKAKRFRKRYNLGFESHFRVPSFIVTEYRYHRLCVMYDKAILCRFPVGFGLHIKHIYSRSFHGIAQLPGRMIHDLNFFQVVEKILFFTMGQDTENLRFYQFHTHAFEGMRKGCFKGHRSVFVLHDHGIRRNYHAEMGKSLPCQKKRYCNDKYQNQAFFHGASFTAKKNHKAMESS